MASAGSLSVNQLLEGTPGGTQAAFSSAAEVLGTRVRESSLRRCRQSWKGLTRFHLSQIVFVRILCKRLEQLQTEIALSHFKHTAVQSLLNTLRQHLDLRTNRHSWQTEKLAARLDIGLTQAERDQFFKLPKCMEWRLKTSAITTYALLLDAGLHAVTVAIHNDAVTGSAPNERAAAVEQCCQACMKVVVRVLPASFLACQWLRSVALPGTRPGGVAALATRSDF